MITKTLFDNYRSKNVYLYELANEEIKVGIIDFGAAIQYIKLNTPNGWRDVCLGFDNVKDYIESGMYCGAAIGRVANRIRNAEFTLNGQKISLVRNEGKNHHHGGAEGFDKKFYAVQEFPDKLVFMRYSRHGEQGYPGDLTFQVEFSISGAGLEVMYVATSDKDTVWGPTCHTYFTLGEKGTDDVLLKINADKFTPIDEEFIPTGEIVPVKDTPFDFREFKPIGRDINEDNVQLKLAGGYDHNFVLNGSHAATAISKKSGIKLDIYTSMPGLQLYSGNFIRGMGSCGKLSPRDGFCLEPQYFPNAVNVRNFETPYLYAGTQKTHFINYYFRLV